MGRETGTRAPRLGIIRVFQVRLSRVMLWVAIIAVLFSAWLFNREHATSQRAWTMRQLHGLTDSDAARRREAAESLYSVGVDDLARTVGALAGALADPDWQVRLAAARSLPETIGRLGGITNSDLTADVDMAARALIPACRDPREEVRIEAIQALGIVYDTSRPAGSGPSAAIAGIAAGVEASRAAAELLEALKDASPRVRAQAIWSFARAGRLAGAAAGPVKEMFENDPERRVRIAAIQSLAVGWPEDTGLHPLLLRRLKVVSDQEERSNIGWALASLGPASASTLPALLDALTDDDRVVRSCIPGALGKLGPAAAPALPALARLARIELAGEGGPFPAILAIRSIAPDSSEGRALVVTLAGMLLDPPEGFERERAMFLLDHFGPSAAPAVGPLRNALKSTNWDVRQYATTVLGFIGPASASAIPDLEKLAREDPDPDVRHSAGYSLRRIKVAN